MAVDSTRVIARLAETLMSARNADGGWGYYEGKASRLEPTCWAILSLFDSGAELPLERLNLGLALLARWQKQNGLLSDIDGAPPNLAFNGLAALLIRRVRERRPVGVPGLAPLEARLLDNIRSEKGVQIRDSKFLRQDNRLPGWPWIDGTFSWVEPTAWCLLAVKKARRTLADPRFDARINEAERLLLNRCCLVGGWNYGNANMLGKELHPYVPTTALGLLALQDRREAPEVLRSRAWLKDHGVTESSVFAFSLALIAARVFGDPGDPLRVKLENQLAQTGGDANLAASGMALYALTGSHHGYKALVV